MSDFDRMASVGSYKPLAIYFQESDCLEYVRCDVPTVYRRIDQFLTLIVSMDDREPIGFSLKGFRNFYTRNISDSDEPQFRTLVRLIEEVVRKLGDDIFVEDKRTAYRKAIEIAQNDKVELTDIPRRNYA